MNLFVRDLSKDLANRMDVYNKVSTLGRVLGVGKPSTAVAVVRSDWRHAVYSILRLLV